MGNNSLTNQQLHDLMEDTLKSTLRADDESAWWDVFSHFNVWFDGGVLQAIIHEAKLWVKIVNQYKRIQIVRWKTYKDKEST